MAVLWTNDHDARALLPSATLDRDRLHVVLFFAQHDAGDAALLTRFDALPVPPKARAVAVDLDGAPAIARWFGIHKTPALAAIRNGALLALEDECEANACQRLIAFARTQLAALDLERQAGRAQEAWR